MKLLVSILIISFIIGFTTGSTKPGKPQSTTQNRQTSHQTVTYTNVINSITAGEPVQIEGVVIQDGSLIVPGSFCSYMPGLFNSGVNVDTISPYTIGNGVYVDGCLIKGGNLTVGNTLILTSLSSSYTIAIKVANISTSRTYTIPDGAGNVEFVMTGGDQFIGGWKLFTGIVTFLNSFVVSGATELNGDVTFSNTPIFYSGSIALGSGQYVRTEATSGTSFYTIPALGNSTFVMVEGIQDITGAKRFYSDLTVSQSNLIFRPGGPALAGYLINTAATPAVTRTCTIPDVSGDADFVMTAGIQDITGAKRFSADLTVSQSNLIFRPGGPALAGYLINTAATPAVTRTCTIPDVSGNSEFVMTEGTQTLNGLKSFSQITSFGAGFSLRPSLSGFSFSILPATPTAFRIYTVPDVSDSQFLMSAGNQTVGGTKNFTSQTIFTAGAYTTSIVVETSTSGKVTIAPQTLGSARTFLLPNVPDAYFVMSDGTQDIAGTKSFLASTNFVSGLATPSTLILKRNAVNNGMEISYIITATNPAIGDIGSPSRTVNIPDVGDANFVMTAGTQTIGGAKTFSSTATVSGLLTASSGLKIGTGTATLSIYEEGTFASNPELLFGGANVGMTYSVRRHRFTRIGRAVLVEVYIIVDLLGSSTGVATVSNFPYAFPAANTGAQLFVSTSAVNYATSYTQIVGSPLASDTTIGLYQTGDSVATVQLTHAAFTSGCSVQIYGWYSV